MRKNILFVILFFIGNVTNAQLDKSKKQLLNTDTLTLSKTNFNEPQKIRTYLDFIFDNFRSDIGNTINICEYLYNRSVELNNKKLMASALNIQGSIYALKNDYSEAAKSYTAAADIFLQINEPYSSAIIYNNLGLLYNNTNNKKIAVQYFQKGLAISDVSGLEKPKSLIYTNLTNLYISQGDFVNALNYGLKADTLFKKLSMKTEQAVVTNLIGAIYFYKSNYTKAVEYYRLSYQLSSETNDIHSQNMALSNIGEVFALQKNPEALVILKRPTQYFTSIKDYVNLQQAYSNYISFFRNIGDNENAVKYLDTLRMVDALLNDSTQKKSIIYYQTKYETQLKENKILQLSQTDSIKSLEIFAQQFQINKNLFNISQQKLALAKDSILLFLQNQTIIQNKLDSALKEEKINELTQEGLQKKLALQKQQAEVKQKKQLLYFLLGGTILVATLLFLLFYQRNIKKLAEEKELSQKALVNSILETEEKERSRIAKDLHDGIVQDLTAIKFELTAITQQVPDTLKMQLNNVSQTVDATSKEVREISYQMMPITLRELGLEKAIKELLNRSLAKNNIEFEFDAIGIENRLPEKIETTVYRICQELLNNTIKHSQATSVSLLLQVRNNVLQLTYEDNGVGFNATTTKKGIGLNSLNSRIEMVKGSLQFDNSETTGTTAYIRIPL